MSSLKQYARLLTKIGRMIDDNELTLLDNRVIGLVEEIDFTELGALLHNHITLLERLKAWEEYQGGFEARVWADVRGALE